MSDCTICGGTGYLRRDLPTSDPAFGQVIPCECELARRAAKRARELRDASGVSDAVFQRLTFETFDPSRAVKAACDMALVKRDCEACAAEPNGWLILAGLYGVGKTHLAYAIAGALLRRGVPVYAASVPEMLGMIRNGFSDAQGFSAEQRLKALRTVDVLILDDWGTEKGSDWVSETLFTVLNSRYNDRLATVITTNLKREELAQKDARLASRMLDTSLSRVHVMVAGDYRRRVG